MWCFHCFSERNCFFKCLYRLMVGFFEEKFCVSSWDSFFRIGVKILTNYVCFCFSDRGRVCNLWKWCGEIFERWGLLSELGCRGWRCGSCTDFEMKSRSGMSWYLDWVCKMLLSRSVFCWVVHRKFLFFFKWNDRLFVVRSLCWIDLRLCGCCLNRSFWCLVFSM